MFLDNKHRMECSETDDGKVECILLKQVHEGRWKVIDRTIEKTSVEGALIFRKKLGLI